MARTDTTEGQALWQPGGAENSRFREGDRHLGLAYDDEEEDCRSSATLGCWLQIKFSTYSSHGELTPALPVAAPSLY